MKKLFKIMLVAAMIVTGMAVSQHAQAQTPQNLKFTFVVFDEQGEVFISEATVTLTDSSGNEKKMETNEDGAVVFSGLAPGIYSVEVSKEGFATMKLSGLILNANREIEILLIEAR